MHSWADLLHQNRILLLVPLAEVVDLCSVLRLNDWTLHVCMAARGKKIKLSYTPMGGPPETRNSGDVDNQPYIWFVEYITPNDAYHHGVQELLMTKRTPYQSMIIGDTGAYGRALFLDGKIQIAEGDEAFYHEPLVHPPILLNRSAKSILILGGADGGAAREALRWKSVERVVVVDIDRDVVEGCRTHLPRIADGAFEDSRCKIVIEDALDFIDEGTESFDVILCDLTDPMENSPSLSLFTKEFFQKVFNRLSTDGVMSIQGGPLSLVESPTLFSKNCLYSFFSI